VGGRVGLFAAEIRELEGMSVDGDLPLVREFLGCADVIEVSMGEEDGLGGRAEALMGPLADVAGRKREAGVDERPRTGVVSDGKDVDEEDAEAEDVIGDMGQGNDVFFRKGYGGHRALGKETQL
jgi:hypothetical protein